MLEANPPAVIEKSGVEVPIVKILVFNPRVEDARTKRLAGVVVPIPIFPWEVIYILIFAVSDTPPVPKIIGATRVENTKPPVAPAPNE